MGVFVSLPFVHLYTVLVYIGSLLLHTGIFFVSLHFVRLYTVLVHNKQFIASHW